MASVATKIFQELVQGVFYIHSMGIVHRDLKVSGGDRITGSNGNLSGMMCYEFIELNEVMLIYLGGYHFYKSLFHRSGT